MSDVTKASSGDRRRRLRRQEIVLEATKLFAERGYEGASMGDLAERVGLRKASVFHHFASKEDLYATVLKELVEEVQTAIVTAAQSRGSFADRLDVMTDALTVVLGSKPHTARLLIREVMDRGPVMRGALADTIEGVLAAALSFAQEGQRLGVFARDQDARQMIVSIIGIHFMPFLIDDVVRRFVGSSSFGESYLAARKEAVKDQVRRLVLTR